MPALKHIPISIALAASLLTITACNKSARDSEDVVLPSDLRLILEISPDTIVSPNDPIVTVIAENAGSDTLLLAIGYLSFTIEGEGASPLQLPVGPRLPGPFGAIAPGENYARKFAHGLNDEQVQWRLKPGVYQARALFIGISESELLWLERIIAEHPEQIPDGKLWTQRVESPPLLLTVLDPDRATPLNE